MATLRIHGTNDSISKRKNYEKKRLARISKLDKNSDLLKRLGDILALGEGWDTPQEQGNSLALVYVGDDFTKDKEKIERTLYIRLNKKNQATGVQLGRIVVDLTIEVPKTAEAA